MKVLIKFLFLFGFSFIIILGLMTLLIYKFRDKELPFQEKIIEMTRKETVIDSTSLTGIPTAEQIREKDYEERKLKIEEKEAELAQEEGRIRVKGDSLTILRDQLQVLIGQQEGIKAERITKLAKVYEGMRPEEAAPIISELDDQTIVELFLKMNDRRVSRILGALPLDRATEITQRLTASF